MMFVLHSHPVKCLIGVQIKRPDVLCHMAPAFLCDSLVCKCDTVQRIKAEALFNQIALCRARFLTCFWGVGLHGGVYTQTNIRLSKQRSSDTL